MNHILRIKNMIHTQDTPSDVIDVYELSSCDLSRYKGIIISMGADQIHLLHNKEKLTTWVKEGGKLLANGLCMTPYVENFPEHRFMEVHGIEDFWLSAVEDHPIWHGIDRKDLLLKTGVPGTHSFEELKHIGVAGFYARSFLTRLPDNARIITGIGMGKLPVDISYTLGKGEVIIHNGNDLESFACPHTSTEGLARAVQDYLSRAGVYTTDLD